MKGNKMVTVHSKKGLNGSASNLKSAVNVKKTAATKTVVKKTEIAPKITNSKLPVAKSSVSKSNKITPQVRKSSVISSNSSQIKSSGIRAKSVKIPPVVISPEKPKKSAQVLVSEKEKFKKPKLVRDSFTMPETEYAVLSTVKKACLSAGIEVKKSQLLRIGLLLLSQTELAKLKMLIAGLAPLKAGRPKKDK